MNATTRPMAKAIWIAMLAMGSPALAWAQQRDFDIPASDMASALPQFARQAGLQIVAPGENLRGVRAPALKGSMDARAALKTLISGSSLRIADDDGSTITLQATGPDLASLGGIASSNQASAGAAATIAAGSQQSAPAAVPAPAKPATEPTAATESKPAPNPSVQDLDRVTVTGSFIRRIDAETALPVTTLGQDQFDLSGAMTLSDVLSYLPQSAGFDNNETSTGPNAARGDAASINLRGIGSGNTLVLLNGRRIAPFPISEGAVPRLSSNINQIPLGAIQRVEVLRDGASALYGSDAVAGVVNTILKKDYDGAEATVRYGHVQDGGLGEKTVNLLGGKNLDDGRTNIMGFAGYYNRTALDASDKSFSQTGDLRERAHSTDTRWDNRSLSGPYGNFSTGIANADGSFTTKKGPGLTGSSFHTEPGPGGAVVRNGSLPRDLRYDYTPEYVLLPETTRKQLFGAVNHAFDNDMEVFAEGFYYHADSFIANATTPISFNSDNGIYVPKTNYYNPFGTRFYGPGTANPGIAPLDVKLNNYRPVELGKRTANVTSRAYQFLGGLRGYLGQWSWEVGAEHGQGRTRDNAGNMISESRLRQQLALNTPDAFNPFGGPGANSQAVLDAIRIETWREGTTTLSVYDAKAVGPLFDLPGGTVQMATGVEYRIEGYKDRRDPFSNGNDVIALSQTSDSTGQRNVKSLFVEFSVPIFSEANAMPGFRRMELSVAGRTEDYSDFGRATKPKFGLTWSPADWLLLRGSYSEGFRAPTLAQVFVGEIIRRNTGTPDPYRADVTGTPADLGDESRQVIRGGNPDLGPEQAKEHSVGFVLQPLEGLSLSVDYFKIRQTDVIDTYGEAQQLALDFQLRTTGQGFNPAVVRLPVTPADQAAFDAYNAAHPGSTRTAVGAVDYVLDTFINIADRTVSGYDASLVYRLPESDYGKFTFRADMAYLDRFDERVDPDSPTTSPLQINGLPKTRGVFGVLWQGKRVDAGLQGNYIGSFYDTSAPKNDDGSDFKVDDWLTFNGFVGVKLGATGSGSGAQNYLRFGVNNLLDKDPPLADEDRGFFETVHDGRGRFFYLEWRVKM